ncbi:MAG: hypothetical protein ABIQ43_02460 [Sphingomonas sp.]
MTDRPPWGWTVNQYAVGPLAMTRRRSATPLHRRFAWLMLPLCVLLTRAAGSEGWMPGKTATGAFAIVACDGVQPDDTMPMAMGMTMSHDTSHHAPGKNQSSGHPCTFAGIGIADAPPQFAIDIPSTPYAGRGALTVVAIVPGRGLAAPPPPATGPPALA